MGSKFSKSKKSSDQLSSELKSQREALALSNTFNAAVDYFKLVEKTAAALEQKIKSVQQGKVTSNQQKELDKLKNTFSLITAIKIVAQEKAAEWENKPINLANVQQIQKERNALEQRVQKTGLKEAVAKAQMNKGYSNEPRVPSKISSSQHAELAKALRAAEAAGSESISPAAPKASGAKKAEAAGSESSGSSLTSTYLISDISEKRRKYLERSSSSSQAASRSAHLSGTGSKDDQSYSGGAGSEDGYKDGKRIIKNPDQMWEKYVDDVKNKKKERDSKDPWKKYDSASGSASQDSKSKTLSESPTENARKKLDEHKTNRRLMEGFKKVIHGQPTKFGFGKEKQQKREELKKLVEWGENKPGPKLKKK